jgi:hypothetical protein
MLDTESDKSTEVNEDSELWTTNLPDESKKKSKKIALDKSLSDFLKKYRATACPVMGDDDMALEDEYDSDSSQRSEE